MMKSHILIILVLFIPIIGVAQNIPILNYGTYVGGNDYEGQIETAIHPDGSILLFNTTKSPNQDTVEPITSYTNGHNCMISKVGLNGEQIWSNYFGGAGESWSRDVKCDEAGNIYLAGITSNPNFPVTDDAFQNSMTGSSDTFLSKLNSDGEIIWSTYFGTPTTTETILAIEVSTDDNRLYVLGEAFLPGLATPGAYQDGIGDQNSSVLACFDLDGNVQYITYFTEGYLTNMALTPGGDIYVCGFTNQWMSMNMDEVYQAFNMQTDGILVRFDEEGWPVWGTYFGMAGTDMAYGITADSDNFVYISGIASDAGGLSTNDAYQEEVLGSGDGFIAKFNSAGQREWCTYLGSTGGTDYIDRLYWSAEDDFLYTSFTVPIGGSVIVSPNAFQTTPGGNYDRILARFNTEGAFDWLTYIGGSGTDEIHDMAMLSTGELVVTGSTSSLNGIISEDAINPSLGGYVDDFMMRLQVVPACVYGCTTEGAVNYDPLATCDDGNCVMPELGDLNADGFVDQEDWDILLTDFGCTGDCIGDLDGDGEVGISDMMLMLGLL